MGEPPEGMTIDHEDRNGLNNRRDNLRFITFSENTRNSGFVESASNIEKRGNSYRARIKINGERISLGSFQTEWDAKQAIKDFLCAL
jgi:HNH endonuclease